MNSITSACKSFWQISGFSNEHKKTRENVLLVERVALATIGLLATHVFGVPGIFTLTVGYCLTSETTNLTSGFYCIGYAFYALADSPDLFGLFRFFVNMGIGGLFIEHAKNFQPIGPGFIESGMKDFAYDLSTNILMSKSRG